MAIIGIQSTSEIYFNPRLRKQYLPTRTDTLGSQGSFDGALQLALGRFLENAAGGSSPCGEWCCTRAR
jgi:hypothetical protein